MFCWSLQDFFEDNKLERKSRAADFALVRLQVNSIMCLWWYGLVMLCAKDLTLSFSPLKHTHTHTHTHTHRPKLQCGSNKCCRFLNGQTRSEWHHVFVVVMLCAKIQLYTSLFPSIHTHTHIHTQTQNVLYQEVKNVAYGNEQINN